MLREGYNKGDKIGAQHNNSPSQGLTVGQNPHETPRILTSAVALVSTRILRRCRR